VRTVNCTGSLFSKVAETKTHYHSFLFHVDSNKPLDSVKCLHNQITLLNLFSKLIQFLHRPFPKKCFCIIKPHYQSPFMYRLTTKPWQHTDSLPEFVFHEGKEKQRPSRLFSRSKATEGKHYLITVPTLQ
jgi:hypothetical protein